MLFSFALTMTFKKSNSNKKSMVSILIPTKMNTFLQAEFEYEILPRFTIC